jgi:hypothetical protein
MTSRVERSAQAAAVADWRHHLRPRRHANDAVVHV